MADICSQTCLTDTKKTKKLRESFTPSYLNTTV